MSERLSLIAVLNGPNMNMLGLRHSGLPDASGLPNASGLHGAATLDDVESLCAEAAEALSLAIDFRQTNHEGELVSWVQDCRSRAAGIVINPSGYAQSLAVVDALLASELPVVEVHVHNIHRGQSFRRRSLVSTVAVGVICGLGIGGYALALTAMAELLLDKERP